MLVCKSKFVFLFGIILFLGGCIVSKKNVVAPDAIVIASLHYLGEKDIPYNFLYNNTTVGGLSGIDYDAVAKNYYLISDDRSALNPARFYTASIAFTQAGIDSIKFTGVHFLLQPDGNTYPNTATDRYHTPDPESIRYNPFTKKLWWTSEGERIVSAKDTILEDPAINIVSTDGRFLDSIIIPDNLRMQAMEKGPRQNGVFEGLTFADNYKNIFVSVEEPLHEDGPRVDVTDKNTFIRILKFNAANKKNISQYAYKPDNIAYAAIPADKFKINGIPDILYLGNNKMLVLERSYSTGHLNCTIKVFIADLNQATDITNLPLKNNAGKFTPISKKLLLNMDELGIYIDNIEGVTFGPDLPNGHKTLLFIADNNFSSSQVSQLLLFEVNQF